MVQAALCDCTELDTQQATLAEEMEIVGELIRQCIEENTSKVQNQEEYMERYERHTRRYEKMKKRYEAIEAERQRRKEQNDRISAFSAMLAGQSEMPIEFNDDLWLAAVDHATVNADETVTFEKCLKAGVLPKIYEGTGITVEVQTKGAISCFLRDKEGHVSCPMGHELRYSRKRGKCVVYKDREYCRACRNKCTHGEWKEVSFGPETDCVPVRMFGILTEGVQGIPPDARISPSNHTLDTGHVPKKKVVLRIQDDKEKLKQRMCLSEHPFGTVKWYRGAHYLLCKGKEKAAAELGLSFLAYNMTRAIHLVGAKALIEAM